MCLYLLTILAVKLVKLKATPLVHYQEYRLLMKNENGTYKLRLNRGWGNMNGLFEKEW